MTRVRLLGIAALLAALLILIVALSRFLLPLALTDSLVEAAASGNRPRVHALLARGAECEQACA
ncbi:MAG: hypothetical protein C4321_11000 [Chloroflexota bacterium]